jgi:hypothetical protein
MGSSNSGDFTAKNMWEEIKKVHFTDIAPFSTCRHLSRVFATCFMFSERVIFWPWHICYTQHGSFSEACSDKEPRVSKPGSSIGAAVAAATTVPAGGTRVVSFALSWSCPEVKFSDGKTYHRWRAFILLWFCMVYSSWFSLLLTLYSGTGGTPNFTALIEMQLQSAWLMMPFLVRSVDCALLVSVLMLICYSLFLLSM